MSWRARRLPLRRTVGVVVRFTRSLKDLAMSLSAFLPPLQIRQMPLIDRVGIANELAVKPALVDAGFIASDEQDCSSTGIECEGDPQDGCFRLRP